MIVLGIDLGGTSIKFGAVDASGVIACRERPADGAVSFSAALDAAADSLRTLLGERAIDPGGCAGVGVGFPGVVSPEGRIVRTFGKYDDAPAVDVAAWGHETLGLPVALENDANIACLGEWRVGAARGEKNVVMLTLGTGIGSSAIINGEPLRGARGAAGNLGGNLVVRIGGRASAYGLRGIAEMEAAQGVLGEIVREHPGYATSALAGAPVLDYRAVFEQADAGDAVARDIVAQSLEVWSAATLNMIHAYDADVAVLGGGIVRRKDVIIPAVQDAVDRTSVAIEGKRARVVAAEEPGQSALLGAYAAVERWAL